MSGFSGEAVLAIFVTCFILAAGRQFAQKMIPVARLLRFLRHRSSRAAARRERHAEHFAHRIPRDAPSRTTTDAPSILNHLHMKAFVDAVIDISLLMNFIG